MSYSFSWGSLLQNQWIDRTALASAMQSFIFYSITGSNQPTSSPNFDTTSNRFLTKANINSYVYSPIYTSTGVSKTSSQYICVQDLVPQSLTFSVYTGFSSPQSMIYNPNDGLIYVVDSDAGNINRMQIGGNVHDINGGSSYPYFYNLTYSNIYSFNPLQLGTSSYVFGSPGSASGITLSYYGTVSTINYTSTSPTWTNSYSYLTDWTVNSRIDYDMNKIYLVGQSNIYGDNGGLRIFDINSHQLITVPYGNNYYYYYRLSINILTDKLIITSGSSIYSLNRPTKSSDLFSQLNGLTNSLTQIFFEKDSNGRDIFFSSSIIQVGNYLCLMSTQDTSSGGGSIYGSPYLGIFNSVLSGSTYSLVATYSFPTAVFKTYYYARGVTYYDTIYNKLYLVDKGTSSVTVVDVSGGLSTNGVNGSNFVNTPNTWTNIFTCYFNGGNPPSSNYSTLSINILSYADVNVVINPNNGDMYCSCYFNTSPGAIPDYLITYLVNRKANNLSEFVNSYYYGVHFSQLISANGFNLYGSSGNTIIWANNPSSGGNYNGVWSTDGTLIKYGLNITGVK